MEHYLLIVYEGVQPELQGPFETERERDEQAVQHRLDDPGKSDSLFRLDVEDGEPAVYPYEDDELDSEDLYEEDAEEEDYLEEEDYDDR